MFSTGSRIAEADARTVSHRRDMPISLAYAIALAEARSCLAALADMAIDFDDSVLYEHLLLDLDALHHDGCPALRPVTGDRAELLTRLEVAVDRMIDLGGQALRFEILLARAGTY